MSGERSAPGVAIAGPNSIVAMNLPSMGASFWDVFSEDLAAPDSHSEWLRREHALMAATLAQAVRDCETLAGGNVTGTNRTKATLRSDHAREVLDMIEWIDAGTLDWPFSLPSICSHLRLDLAAMQRRLHGVLAGDVECRTWRGREVASRTTVQDMDAVRARGVAWKRQHRARGGK